MLLSLLSLPTGSIGINIGTESILKYAVDPIDRLPASQGWDYIDIQKALSSPSFVGWALPTSQIQAEQQLQPT